jgi:hypothetical protein
MAKKKSQNKKHKFKYAEPTSGVGQASQVVQSSEVISTQLNRSAAPQGRPARVQSLADTRDFSYVGQDLRRIGVLAGSLLALEIALWYLFGHTGIGSTVYNLVSV